jgi:hypothetical protein
MSEPTAFADLPVTSRPHCPVCGAEGVELLRVPTINPTVSVSVELRECPDCGHWWHSPAPAQNVLSSLYEQASPYVVGLGARQSYQSKTGGDDFHQYVLARITGPVGTYLEIGAGGGALLRLFRARGYTAYGVDPGQWVDEPNIVRRLEDLPATLCSNTLVLQDVLEHLLDPVGLLRALAARAAPRCQIFCSFPCKDSSPARRQREAWPMLRPFGHLHYFSRRSADLMLANSGWQQTDQCLAHITGLAGLARRGLWRQLAYEVVKGGRDQLYVAGRRAEPSNTPESSH